MDEISERPLEVFEKPLENNEENDKSRKCRNWFITCNNWTQLTHDNIVGLKNCQFLFQHEVGELGTPHIQGTLMFKNARSWDQLRKAIGEYYFKPAKNIHACLNYCKKVKTRVSDNYFTNIPKFMKQTPFQYEFKWWQQLALNYLAAPPVKVDRDRILWIWSAMGSIGKTTFLKWFHRNNRTQFVVSGGRETDCLNAIIQHIETHNCEPKGVFWLLPRVKGNTISNSALEQIADGFFYSGKYTGGILNTEKPLKVVIIANSPPDKSKQSSDRLRVIQVDDYDVAATRLQKFFRASARRPSAE